MSGMQSVVEVEWWLAGVVFSSSSVHHRASFSDGQSRSDGHAWLRRWWRPGPGHLVA